MRCRVDHEKGNFVSTSNHVLFSWSYRHNNPLLTRKVDSIINENKRMCNPHVKIGKCVGALKMNTCVASLHGPTFQYTKFSVIELVLTDKRNLSGTRQKSACSKSFSCRFLLSAAKNVITKATEYVISGFSFSSPSRKVWTSLSVSDTEISVFYLNKFFVLFCFAFFQSRTFRRGDPLECKNLRLRWLSFLFVGGGDIDGINQHYPSSVTWSTKKSFCQNFVRIS